VGGREGGSEGGWVGGWVGWCEGGSEGGWVGGRDHCILMVCVCDGFLLCAGGGEL
jgi:hypothetical protein